MIWGWGDSSDGKDSLVCDFDERQSTISTYKLLGPDQLPEMEGLVVINARKHKLNRIEKFGCLDCASPIRLLHWRYAHKLLAFVSSDQVQLFPATVNAKDGQSHEYVVVVPLHEVKATNIQKSDITHWAEENVFALEYSRLEFYPDCLGDLLIARDTITNTFLISDSLKKEIDSWGNVLGLFILPGSEISTWPYR